MSITAPPKNNTGRIDFLFHATDSGASQPVRGETQPDDSGLLDAYSRTVVSAVARVVNNVTVGQNKPVRRDHESGAVPADFALSTLRGNALFYVNINYRRRNPCDCADDRARICVE